MSWECAAAAAVKQCRVARTDCRPNKQQRLISKTNNRNRHIGSKVATLWQRHRKSKSKKTATSQPAHDLVVGSRNFMTYITWTQISRKSDILKQRADVRTLYFFGATMVPMFALSLCAFINEPTFFLALATLIAVLMPSLFAPRPCPFCHPNFSM